MDTDGRFPTPTTRRTIVATGAKLTYAAPLVATSLKLSAMNVAAISPGSRCAGEATGCTAGGCGPGNSCICTTQRGSRTPFCFSQGCGVPCETSADCVDANGVPIGLCSNNTGGCCSPGDCILFENIALCDATAGLAPLTPVERK
jgi:hypothetical protein